MLSCRALVLPSLPFPSLPPALLLLRAPRARGRALVPQGKRKGADWTVFWQGALQDTTVAGVRGVLREADAGSERSRWGAGSGGQRMSLVIPPLGPQATAHVTLSLLQALHAQEPPEGGTGVGWEVVVCVCDTDSDEWLSALLRRESRVIAERVDCSNVGAALNRALRRASGTVVSHVSGCLRYVGTCARARAGGEALEGKPLRRARRLMANMAGSRKTRRARMQHLLCPLLPVPVPVPVCASSRSRAGGMSRAEDQRDWTRGPNHGAGAQVARGMGGRGHGLVSADLEQLRQQPR